MLAVKLVEIAIVGRMVLRPVPPVPIAAFGDEDLLEGQFALRLADVGGILRVELPSVGHIIPSSIVLGRADPDVEVCIDPRPGYKRRQLAEITMTRYRL